MVGGTSLGGEWVKVVVAVEGDGGSSALTLARVHWVPALTTDSGTLGGGGGDATDGTGDGCKWGVWTPYLRRPGQARL